MPENIAGVKGLEEMNVFERQSLVLKWQQQQQQQQILQFQQQQQRQEQSWLSDLSVLSVLQAQVQNFQGLNMDCIPNPVPSGPSPNGFLTRPIKPDPGVENRWVDFGLPKNGVNVEGLEIDSVGQVKNFGCGMNYTISKDANCPPLATATATKAAAESRGKECYVSDQKLSSAVDTESFKKRKAEKCLTAPKRGGEEEDSRSKRRKGCAEEEESKVTVQNSNRNSSNKQSNHKESNDNNNDQKNKETSGCTSKASEVQKPDYIHVRARRGQATDSHSLAERVRREKISERMKYLQDLVPGCNKITGKAGMLDEIINYVQSLQKQVEFLSMKLATVNPQLEFNIDNLIAKEVFAACSSSMPTLGVTPDMTNPPYLQYNPIQQMNPVCGSEVAANSINMELQRTINVPVSVPETFIDPSCFHQIPSSLPWHADLQNVYPLEFQQGRSSTAFPSQTFTGSIEASGLKMEM